MALVRDGMPPGWHPIPSPPDRTRGDFMIARRELNAKIQRKLRRMKILTKKKLGEITLEEVEELRRLSKEVLDDMMTWVRG